MQNSSATLIHKIEIYINHRVENLHLVTRQCSANFDQDTISKMKIDQYVRVHQNFVELLMRRTF